MPTPSSPQMRVRGGSLFAADPTLASNASGWRPFFSLSPSLAAGEGEADSDVGKTTGGGGFASFVHAGLCMLAFLLVIPFGALVVRYAKATGSSAAFDLHRNLQFGVGMFRVLVRVR